MFKISGIDDDGNSLISKVGNLINKCPECGNNLLLTGITKENDKQYVNYICESFEKSHYGYTTKEIWEKGLLKKSDNMDMEESFHYSQTLIKDMQEKANKLKLNTYISEYQKELLKSLNTTLEYLYKEFEF